MIIRLGRRALWHAAVYRCRPLRLLRGATNLRVARERKDGGTCASSASSKMRLKRRCIRSRSASSRVIELICRDELLDVHQRLFRRSPSKLCLCIADAAHERGGLGRFRIPAGHQVLGSGHSGCDQNPARVGSLLEYIQVAQIQSCEGNSDSLSLSLGLEDSTNWQKMSPEWASV